MSWHGKSKLRSAAIRNGYRSGFESKLVEHTNEDDEDFFNNDDD